MSLSISAPEPQFFTMADAARYIGVSRSTFQKWVDAEKIPTYLGVSGLKRFRRIDLDALFTKVAADV